MKPIIYYHVQHDKGKPVSITLERQCETDVAIPVSRVEAFYTGEESLDDWLVVNNELVKNDLGVDVRRRNTVDLVALKSPSGNPALIVAPHYSSKYIEFFIPIQFIEDLEKTSFTLFINDVAHELDTSDFFNGHLRLNAIITKSDRFKVDSPFRTVELVPGYTDTSLRNPNNNVLYLPITERGTFLLPVFLSGTMATYTVMHDHQRVIDSRLVTTEAKYREGLRLIVGNYEIRKN